MSLTPTKQMSMLAADQWWETNGPAIKTAVLGRKNLLSGLRYPQVLRTHSDKELPEDGVEKAPDRKTLKTVDNGEGFGDLGLNLGEKWPCALEVNNYGTRAGNGCEFVTYVREAGVTCRKVQEALGPEKKQRERGWERA